MPIIIENRDAIELNILREIQEYLSPKFKLAAKTTEAKVKVLVKESLVSAPEYLDMLPGGSLYNEIGNPNIEADLTVIINLLLSHITLDAIFKDVTIVRKHIEGSFELNIIRSDFKEILDLSESKFTTEKGSILQWLDWMLIEGKGARLISEFEYLPYTPAGHVSRTGKGIMVFAPNSFWTLPDHAGTRDDNWITRSMNRIEDKIFSSMEEEFVKELSKG